MAESIAGQKRSVCQWMCVNHGGTNYNCYTEIRTFLPPEHVPIPICASGASPCIYAT